MRSFCEHVTVIRAFYTLLVFFFFFVGGCVIYEGVKVSWWDDLDSFGSELGERLQGRRKYIYNRFW